MIVQGILLEQLKRESLILQGFLGSECVSQEMLRPPNRTYLRMKMTQRIELEEKEIWLAGNIFFSTFIHLCLKTILPLGCSIISANKFHFWFKPVLTMVPDSWNKKKRGLLTH